MLTLTLTLTQNRNTNTLTLNPNDTRHRMKHHYTRSPAKQGLADRTAKTAVSVAI